MGVPLICEVMCGPGLDRPTFFSSAVYDDFGRKYLLRNMHFYLV